MDRPPHKYVQANLVDGMLIAAQLIAVAGRSRQVLEVPGLVHQDPMSLGTVMGDLLTTSRIFAASPARSSRARRSTTPKRRRRWCSRTSKQC